MLLVLGGQYDRVGAFREVSGAALARCVDDLSG